MASNQPQAQSSPEGYLQCPLCNERITDILQTLTGWGALSTFGPNTSFRSKTGLMQPWSIDNLEFEYAGETEIIWDSQLDDPDGLARCNNRHVVLIKSCNFVCCSDD